MHVMQDLGLRQRMDDARQRSDELFELVKPEALYERPIPERNRIIFYLGHLEAFDWNLLRERLGVASFHPEFDRLFAFGIDPVGGGLPADQPADWPAEAEVREYVERIRTEIDGDFEKSFEHSGAERLLNVAIEHRLMHTETLAYMLHQMAFERKSYRAEAHPTAEIVRPALIQIPYGSATLGLARQDGIFGWDNEFEEWIADVPGFAIDKYKVTNGQFLEFTEAGGYEDRGLWTDDNWNWKSAERISHPVFWKRAGDQWFYRTMFEEVPLPFDWPAHVSHAEASAYARWAGKLLPTEEQWHRAAYGTPEGEDRLYPWGQDEPSTQGNFGFQRWSPVPVSAHPEGESAFGVADLIGNGWEWTSSLFAPFPGFEPFPFYKGYSADFFDSKHYVMKGGSPRTAACMLRRSFRNWFQPHYPYVYAGFRCVSH
ncbi:MAG TPA: SUMF1/EgtB/PvdO family nonheme iron enzyme [Terriglobales bacterium]